MNLGLNLALGGAVRGAPVSLYTTANFVASGPVDHRDIIDADSFRVARTAAGIGRFDIVSVPSGTYRITGTLSDWDGAALGITTRQLGVFDNFTQVSIITAAGPFDTGVISITSGALVFRNNTNLFGGRVDDFFITRIS